MRVRRIAKMSLERRTARRCVERNAALQACRCELQEAIGSFGSGLMV